MSHITTIKTNVNFKDREVLRQALEELKTQYPATTGKDGKEIPGLTYTYDPAEDKFTIHYRPLDYAYIWHDGNIRLIRTDDQYEMQGDSWNCHKEFNNVTSQLLVNYQKSGVSRYLSTRRFSSTTQASKDGVVVTARRY